MFCLFLQTYNILVGDVNWDEGYYFTYKMAYYFFYLNGWILFEVSIIGAYDFFFNNELSKCLLLKFLSIFLLLKFLPLLDITQD